MSGECGLKSANVSLPAGVGGLAFAGIPEHLVFYGFLMVVSLILYIFFRNIEKCKKLSFSNRHPSLFPELIFGYADDWLIQERGVGAFQYILFLRILIELAVIFLLISCSSFAINFSQGTSTRSLFDSTTISNIPPNSDLQWFNLVISFIILWLVVMMVIRMFKKVGRLKPSMETFGQTLMIESSSFMNVDPENVTKYFEREYPEFKLIKFSHSTDTRSLMGLFTELEFIENVCNVLENSMEDATARGNKHKDVEFYEEQKRNLFDQIEKVKKEASKNTPCVLFLTFLTNGQANQVYNQEMKKSKFCSMKDHLRFAPLPQEIIWSSVQSTSSKWRGWILSTICLFLLVIFCSTPAGFADQIQHLLSKSIAETSNMKGVSTFLPPFLLLLFGMLVPLAVKINTINYGSSSRILSHTSYMSSLCGWLTCSTIIFPIILSGAGNMLELSQSLNSGGWKIVFNKWQCVFSGDAGSFYINLLLVVAFFKCQLELHRVGGWVQFTIAKIKNCRSRERWEAARRKCEVDLTNRNGSNLALAVDYVWVIVFFTVWMFFCLTCPLITTAFLLFIVSKYLVTLQNFRSFYTAKHDQPELLILAAKLIIFASLFPQLNFALFVNITQEDDHPIAFLSMFLYLVNFVILFTNERFNWSAPIILIGPMTSQTQMFHRYQSPSQAQADEELGDASQDDYENPFMSKNVDYMDASPVKTKPAWRNLIFVARDEVSSGISIIGAQALSSEDPQMNE